VKSRLSVLLLLALTLAACSSSSTSSAGSASGGGGGATVNASGGGSGAGSGGTVPQYWPFTGLPAHQPLPHRRVMIVKIDNTTDARPQLGLSSADMVVEEMVEGGLTRLAAFYYSKIPATVGPTRSVRTSDIGFVLPTSAELVASGGGEPTLGRLQRHHIHTAFEGELPGFFRVSDRPEPYNLLIHLRQTAKALPKTAPPKNYLQWDTTPPYNFHGQRVTGLDATFSPAHTSKFRYKRGTGWVNTNSLAAPNDQFTPDNLIVVRVRIHTAFYVDPSGAPVPETILEGSGDAVIVHHDQAVVGRWKKATRGSMFHFTTKSGKRLLIPPGTTQIELVPTSGSVHLTR
jgi:Protein of unknown function (DUF3048) N-terminal domain/Protein of unknown function (DUF3048) C-terminal domain